MDKLLDSGIGSPDLTAILLRHSLRGSALFVALLWLVVLFLSPNKLPAGGVTATATLLMLVIPWWLSRRMAVQAAVYVFLGGALMLSGFLYWFGRGASGPAVVLQFGIVLQATLLLGRGGILWTAIPVLMFDLTKIILEMRGVAIPLYFPSSPLASWMLSAITIAWTMPALLLAMTTLRRSADRLRQHVAELREMNQRLIQSEELRQLISETVPVGILVFDPEGWNVFANSFAVARLGEEVRGMHRERPPWPITDSSGQPFPAEQRLFDRVMATGKAVHSAQIAVERRPGHRIYLSVSVAPLRGADGALRGIVSAFEDITERVAAERNRLHAQRIASMGELAGSIAHDFNNLLTVIRGDSELALKNAPEHAALRTRLERIYKASDSATTLCRQLLAFARREDAAPYPLSLNELIRGNEDLLRGMLPDNVALHLDLDSGLPAALAESSLLLQVLVNLTVNARDAMPAGGTLVLRTTTDPATAAPTLVVEDTGTGMDEGVCQAAFQPYFTTKGSGKGTGLGLAIVYAIVQQFGGTVGVESEPGRGSRFWVQLARA